MDQPGKFFFGILIVLFLSPLCSTSQATLARGQQPQVTIDGSGIIRVAFGRNDSIFCATSLNEGETFTKPALVGIVPKMHLGMARGPQLASSANYSMITVMDKAGNIHFFMLNNRKGSWQNKGLVNDIKGSAPEGLMNVACDNQDNFYAVWLDVRLNKRNNVFFSSLPHGGSLWTKNNLVYQSPDEYVCECCRPSIAVKGPNVAIMFRNRLNGSRDLYLAASVNKGQTFAKAVKLGNGTWKLNACTMDGGGISFNADKTINTVWQRQGMVYYCKPGQDEKELAKGRDCSIYSDHNRDWVSMSENGTVKLEDAATLKTVVVGKGSYMKAIALGTGKLLCVWEDNNVVKAKTI